MAELQIEINNITQALALDIANLTSSNHKFLSEKLQTTLSEEIKNLHQALLVIAENFLTEYELGFSYKQALKAVKKLIGKRLDDFQKGLGNKINVLVRDYHTSSQSLNTDLINRLISEQAKKIGKILKKYYKL